MTAFVTASDTASLTAASCGSRTPAAATNSATAPRSAGTEAGTAGRDRRSDGVTGGARSVPRRAPPSLPLRRDTWCGVPLGPRDYSRGPGGCGAADLRLVAGDEPAEDDDRLRPRDLGMRADALDGRLEVADVGCAQVHERVGLTGDRVGRDDLVLSGERLAQRHRAHVRLAVDLDEGLRVLPERGGIDARGEPRDDPGRAQAVDAPLDGGRGQVHALPELSEAQAPVFEQLGNDAAVDLVYAAKDAGRGAAATRWAPSTASRRSSSQSASAVVSVSAGARRSVRSCVSLASTPAASSSSQTSRPLRPSRGSTSRPNHSPRERIALSAGGAAAARPARSPAPRPAGVGGGSPLASSSRTARPRAQASGLPPNVEPCEPGPKTPSTSSSPATADRATIPPPSALPST